MGRKLIPPLTICPVPESVGSGSDRTTLLISDHYHPKNGRSLSVECDPRVDLFF